jgi:vitamin B12 transporter
MNSTQPRATRVLTQLGWCVHVALLACASTAAAAGAAGARDVPPESLVVTGTRLYSEPALMPNTTTLVDLAQIEARNPLNLLDLLDEQPGLHVSQPGGGGGVSSVFLRGGEPNFTTVFIDGIKVNDPNNSRGGSFDFATLNLGDLERIEIVRGPQSAIYGSDSLSGAINLITRAGADHWGPSFEGEVGIDDAYSVAADLSGPLEGAGGMTVRVASYDQGDVVEGSSFSSDSVNAKLHVDPGSAWRYTLTARHVESDGTAFPEDSGGPDLAVIRERDRKSADDTALGAAGSVDLGSRWQLHAIANWYDHSDEFVSPGIAPGIRDGVPARGADSDLDRYYGGVNLVARFDNGVRATFGGDYQKERGRSVGYVEFAPGFEFPSDFRIDRKIVGAFAEVRREKPEGLTLLGGVRWDDPDSTASETTFKAGVLYTLAGGTQLRANWGQGFKLPSFFALANPLVGNPNLKPEKSDSYDVGVTVPLPGGRGSGTLTLFHNSFKDLIDFDFELFTNVNRTEVTTQGAELELTLDATEALALVSYLTYVDINVKDSDTTLRQRPDWRGSIAARWTPVPEWAVNLSWSYVGETFDSSVPTGPLTVDAYNRVDLNVTHSFTDRLVMQFAVDNLLDESYEDAIGFPAAGILPRLKVRYRL